MIPLDQSILALAGYGIPGAAPLQRHGWSQHLDRIRIGCLNDVNVRLHVWMAHVVAPLDVK